MILHNINFDMLFISGLCFFLFHCDIQISFKLGFVNLWRQINMNFLCQPWNFCQHDKERSSRRNIIRFSKYLSQKLKSFINLFFIDFEIKDQPGWQNSYRFIKIQNVFKLHWNRDLMTEKKSWKSSLRRFKLSITHSFLLKPLLRDSNFNTFHIISLRSIDVHSRRKIRETLTETNIRVDVFSSPNYDQLVTLPFFSLSKLLNLEILICVL